MAATFRLTQDGARLPSPISDFGGRCSDHNEFFRRRRIGYRKMLGTEGWENAIAGIQNSLEFVPKSKADRDLLCGLGGGNSATAFRLQVAPPLCSPEIAVSNTMVSVDEDPTYAPHTVRMRILGLTGVSVEEHNVGENDAQPPPPKYMKSAVAVTRASNLYATSPLSKRLVRASNQSPNHQYIAVWDNNNNNRPSDTNSVTFDVNLPVIEPEEQEQPGSQRSMPHRSYELIVGLTASKRHKPTPVGAACLPLEEASKLRSKSGKIVLDLPVFNFASLTSDPFATNESRTWRQLSILRNSSVSAANPLSPYQMEKVAFCQEQKRNALGCNCYMDATKDAAVLRIELDIQRKIIPKERSTLPENSMVLVQSRLDGIEMAHSEMESSANDSRYVEMESSFERIPHTFGEDEAPAEVSQYRVRIVDNTTMDCSLSEVKVQQADKLGTDQHEVEDTAETKPTKRNQKNRVFASLIHAVKKPTFTDPRNKETKEDSSQRSVTEKSSVPSMEQVTVSSTSESDTPSYRLLDSIKILPSPPRQTTIASAPRPADVTFKPIRSSSVNHEDESRQDTRTPLKGDEETELSETLEHKRDSLFPYARGMGEFFRYDDDNDDVLGSLGDSYTLEESIRRDDLKGNFDEFVGALNDMCRPLNLSDEHTDGASISFRHKPNWVSAVMDGLSEEESSCESRSTVTDEANTTFLQMEDEVEQGEEIDMNDIKIVKTPSFSWTMLRRKNSLSEKDYQYPPQTKPRLRKKLDVMKSQNRISHKLEQALDEPKRIEPVTERSETPVMSSKVKITETGNLGTTDQYSKPVVDFRSETPKTEFKRALPTVPMASPLCFTTSVVDVVSKAFIPTPTPVKKVRTEPVAEMPQLKGQFFPYEGQVTPPIPDVLVNHRDNASVGDLTATSHEMQVDIEEFKLLIKQHLEDAKKPSKKLKDLSFVKDDEKLYAGVDDSWCKGI